MRRCSIANPFERICGISKWTVMKIIERLLDVFGRRRQLLLGATSQPSDLIALIHAVRANAYFKITGKKLPKYELPTGSTIDDMTSDLSPSRRLARRGL